MVQKERRPVLRERLSVLQNTMIADRIVSLGMLAAGLSHHMRNSLQAVQTFLDLAPANWRRTHEPGGLRILNSGRNTTRQSSDRFSASTRCFRLHKASQTSPASFSESSVCTRLCRRPFNG